MSARNQQTSWLQNVLSGTTDGLIPHDTGLDYRISAAAAIDHHRHIDGIGMEGARMSKPGAIIYWHRQNGTKEIYADDLDSWIASLKQQNAFFEVFVLNGTVPIPQNVTRRA